MIRLEDHYNIINTRNRYPISIFIVHFLQSTEPKGENKQLINNQNLKIQTHTQHNPFKSTKITPHNKKQNSN